MSALTDSISKGCWCDTWQKMSASLILIAKIAQQNLAEDVSLTDSLVKPVHLAEDVGLTDSVAKMAQQNLAESVSLTDSLVKDS